MYSVILSKFVDTNIYLCTHSPTVIIVIVMPYIYISL